VYLAEMLRTQAQLLLDTEYLKNANLFAFDVKEEANRVERNQLLQLMQEMGTD